MRDVERADGGRVVTDDRADAAQTPGNRGHNFFGVLAFTLINWVFRVLRSTNVAIALRPVFPITESPSVRLRARPGGLGVPQLVQRFNPGSVNSVEPDIFGHGKVSSRL